MSEIPRPSDDEEKSSDSKDFKQAPRGDARNAFLRAWERMMSGEAKKKPESEEDDEDDDDSPETSKSKRVGRLRGKLMGLLVGKEEVRDPVHSSKQEKTEQQPLATDPSLSSPAAESSERQTEQPQSVEATQGALSTDAEAVTPSDTVQTESDSIQESAPHSAQSAEVQDTAAEEASYRQHEPSELPAPVAAQEEAWTQAPASESVIHLRQQQEADLRQQEVAVAERAAVRPEVRYARDPQARRLAALATVGVVGEHFISKSRDQKLERELQSQRKEIKNQTKATELRFATIAQDRQPTPARPPETIAAPAAADTLKVPQHYSPEAQRMPLVEKQTSPRPEAAARQPAEKLEPSSVATVAESNQRNLQELIEKRYAGARPEEILHKVEEAAEKNAAVEGIYELRHEIRHDQGFAVASQTADSQARLPGTSVPIDHQLAVSTEGNNRGFIKNLQKKLQNDQQYRAVATGGAGAAVLLIILLVVLLMMR